MSIDKEAPDGELRAPGRGPDGALAATVGLPESVAHARETTRDSRRSAEDPLDDLLGALARRGERARTRPTEECSPRLAPSPPLS